MIDIVFLKNLIDFLLTGWEPTGHIEGECHDPERHLVYLFILLIHLDSLGDGLNSIFQPYVIDNYLFEDGCLAHFPQHFSVEVVFSPAEYWGPI